MNNTLRPLYAIGILFALAVAIVLSLTVSKLAFVAAPVLANPLCIESLPPEIDARAAEVYDLASGEVLFEKNATAQLPLASLTKLMTVYVASGILQAADTVAITADALTPEGDSGLFDGELWRTDDLTDFTLMTSSNDGARALMLQSARAADITPADVLTRMNTVAAELGLKQTYFLNETGLDISSTTAGAYGSAHDLALLASYLTTHAVDVVDGSAQAERTFVSLSGYEHHASHTSESALRLAGGTLFKTGYTDLAGGNFVAVAEPILGKPVALVVLGSPLEEREEDIVRLYTFAQTLQKRATLCSEFGQ